MTARARRRGLSNPMVTTRKGSASERPTMSTGMERAFAIGRPRMNAKIEEIRIVEAVEFHGRCFKVDLIVWSLGDFREGGV